MRLLAFASVLAVQGLVSASAHYPKIVQWERTENETFVSQPNVLNGVDHVTVGIVDANPRRGEIHLYTDREIGNKVHECVEDDRNLQPKLEVIKPDLPGAFMCGGNKTMYVIPVIHVQLDRFFNVSLDFLRLRSIDGNLKFIHHHNLPPGLTFEATPSGIVCVSGIVRRGAGTLVSRLTFRSPTGNAPLNILYRIKIILHVKESEPKPNQTRVEIDMVPNRIDSSVSDIQQQIRAVKCAASALSLNPWDLYGVNSEKDFVSFLRLQAYFEFTESSCVPDPKRCDDFSITRIDSNQPRCNVLATNEHLDRKPETMETTEKNESEEIETGTESVVRISNNEIVSSAPISTTATTPKQDAEVSETPKQDANVSEIPKHVADVSETPKNVADASETSKNDADVSEEPKSVDSESDSGVRSDSIPPTLLQNEVSNRILDDPNLKTALYGMIGLAATVGAIIFLFLCSKLELCKKEAGYDPVFMARISDDNGKFA